MQGFAADVEEARRARDPSTGPATLEAYLEVARSSVTTDLFVALICVLSAGVRVPASVPDSAQYIHIRVRIQPLPLVCMFRLEGPLQSRNREGRIVGSLPLKEMLA
jgi:hypothetical protein